MFYPDGCRGWSCSERSRVPPNLAPKCSLNEHLQPNAHPPQLVGSRDGEGRRRREVQYVCGSYTIFQGRDAVRHYCRISAQKGFCLLGGPEMMSKRPVLEHSH